MPLLQLQSVSKSFGPPDKSSAVLHDINLSIEEGEFVAIIGYSGSGKTTLISMIAGLLAPDSGKILLNGQPITGPGPDRGIVFQNYSLLPWLTVYENVHLAVDQVFPQWTSEKKKQHTEHFIRMVNLSDAVDKKPGALSGGMRQRVSVARALAADPKVLLLDEPLSALDALTRATLQDEIGRIREASNKTVVLITNDVDEGLLLADRIIPLTRGPGATLGPSIPVPIARPRDRAALNHDPLFKKIRAEVIDFLLQCKAREITNITRTLVLPDIEPEDLETPDFFARRRGPIRRSEIKREAVQA
ncbi:MAG: ABC transporter ATP-binding protein [Methylacidiphilales bacterium]|nr:ABC transporter ATP-binding protein [Candidatus Methylacidiphilales bacterium]